MRYFYAQVENNICIATINTDVEIKKAGFVRIEESENVVVIGNKLVNGVWVKMPED